MALICARANEQYARARRLAGERYADRLRSHIAFFGWTRRAARRLRPRNLRLIPFDQTCDARTLEAAIEADIAVGRKARSWRLGTTATTALDDE
jgi:hypothetical protein